MKLCDRSIEIVFEQPENCRCREPVTQGQPWVAKDALEPRAGTSCGTYALVDQHQVQINLVEISAPRIEVRRSLLDRLVGDRLIARRRGDRSHPPLAQILIDTTVLVEHAERRFEPVDDLPTAVNIEAFVVDALQQEDDADMPGLRQKRVLVHKTPECEQAVDAAGLVVIAEDALDGQHGRTSTSKRACLAASYRNRTRDAERRIRSICGSCRVAHHAQMY